MRLEHIRKPPPNVGEYIAEIGGGLAALYGEEASRQYRQTARGVLRTTLAHAAVDGMAVCDGKDAAGLLFAVARENMGQISFIHVLTRYAGMGVEDRLVQEGVRVFRAGAVDGIVAEYVPFCPLELDDVYKTLGFERVERLLMTAPLSHGALGVTDSPVSRPYDQAQWGEVAGTIVEAYRDHPGRRLHIEVRGPSEAMGFLESVASGGYGTVRGGYGRAVWLDGRCAGIIVGCEVAPGMGFILQVAVHPASRNLGIGRQLVCELADEFRKAGLTRVALGVTETNPARRLYKGLGFAPLRSVNAYSWWHVLEAA